MSTLDQVKDNIETSLKAEPFTAEEEKAYFEAMDIYRDSAPIDRAGIEKYSGMQRRLTQLLSITSLKLRAMK
jgi:hypothetical protein